MTYQRPHSCVGAISCALIMLWAVGCHRSGGVNQPQANGLVLEPLSRTAEAVGSCHILSDSEIGFGDSFTTRVHRTLAKDAVLLQLDTPFVWQRVRYVAVRIYQEIVPSLHNAIHVRIDFYESMENASSAQKEMVCYYVFPESARKALPWPIEVRPMQDPLSHQSPQRRD